MWRNVSSKCSPPISKLSTRAISWANSLRGVFLTCMLKLCWRVTAKDHLMHYKIAELVKVSLKRHRNPPLCQNSIKEWLARITQSIDKDTGKASAKTRSPPPRKPQSFTSKTNNLSSQTTKATCSTSERDKTSPNSSEWSIGGNSLRKNKKNKINPHPQHQSNQGWTCDVVATSTKVKWAACPQKRTS